MDAEDAFSLIQAMADGVDPIDGSDLPGDSLLQRPKVVRALMVAMQAMEREMVRARRRPPNAGRPWTEDADRELREAFEAGEAIGALAGRLGRTPAAIRARLDLQGLLVEQGESY